MSFVSTEAFYRAKKTIRTKNIVFIVGTKGSGKSTLLRELNARVQLDKHTCLCDLADLNEDEGIDLIGSVISDIENEKTATYFIDNIQRHITPENAIKKIAQAFSVHRDAPTKAIITGGMPIAIEDWIGRAFCGDDDAINLINLDFCAGVDYHLPDTLHQYLKTCIDDAMFCYEQTTNILADSYLNDDLEPLGEYMLDDIVKALILGKKTDYPISDIIKGLVFLYRNKLISVPNSRTPRATLKDLERYNSDNWYTDMDICVKYPLTSLIEKETAL